MRVLEGAIFDMDGVLLDNVDFHIEAFRLFGEEKGAVLSRQDVHAVIGRKNCDMLKILLKRSLSDPEVDRFAARKEEIYRDLIRPVLSQQVVPGLPVLLDQLTVEGIPLALATSGPVENVDLVLDGLSLRGYFRAIVTGRDVSHGKPDPECFLLAASQLGHQPSSCVVFEDSVSGVRAALNAGCKCVAVTTTHCPSELEEVSPNLIVEDFRFLEPGKLRQL